MDWPANCDSPLSPECCDVQAFDLTASVLSVAWGCRWVTDMEAVIDGVFALHIVLLGLGKFDSKNSLRFGFLSAEENVNKELKSCEHCYLFSPCRSRSVI